MEPTTHSSNTTQTFVRKESSNDKRTVFRRTKPSRSTENASIASVLANTTSVGQNSLQSIEPPLTTTPSRTPSGSVIRKDSGGGHPLEHLREPSISQKGSPRPQSLHPGLTIATTSDTSAPSATPSPSTGRSSFAFSVLDSRPSYNDEGSRRPTNMSNTSGISAALNQPSNDDSQRSIEPVTEEHLNDVPQVVTTDKKPLTINVRDGLGIGYHAPETPQTVIHHVRELRRRPTCQVITNVCLSILSLGAGIATTISPVRYVAGPILIAITPFFGWNAKKFNSETEEKIKQLTTEVEKLNKEKEELKKKISVVKREREDMNNVFSQQSKEKHVEVLVKEREVFELQHEVRTLRSNTKAIEENADSSAFNSEVTKIIEKIEVTSRKLGELSPQETKGFNDARSAIHRLIRAELNLNNLFNRLEGYIEKENPEEKKEQK